MRILLVDDSRTMRNIERAVLAQLGFYDVDEASDGREALARSVFTAPELILVDATMPGMDGFAFVRAFHEANSLIPIILMAARDEEFDLESLPRGITGLVVKPFTPAKLRECIESALGIDGLQQAA